MPYKVGAYITAYLDNVALNKCLQRIIQQSYQVEAIFIVDNSPTPIIQRQDNLVFVNHQPSNVGVGKGLEMAVNWSLQEGYDFLWTFEQDSFPKKDCLEILLKIYQKLSNDEYKIGIIAPTPIDIRNNRIIQGATFKEDTFLGCTPKSQEYPYECDAPITSGSLISLTAAKTISPPRSDLFIDGIDIDYGMRLRQKGFHNLIVPQAIMYHSFGNPRQVKFLQRELTIHNYSALRHYYICRNHTYLETRYAQGWYRLTSSLRRIKYAVYTIVKIIFYENESQSNKIWACLLGTYHGFIGKLGKLWQ